MIIMISRCLINFHPQHDSAIHRPGPDDRVVGVPPRRARLQPRDGDGVAHDRSLAVVPVLPGRPDRRPRDALLSVVFVVGVGVGVGIGIIAQEIHVDGRRVRARRDHRLPGERRRN